MFTLNAKGRLIILDGPVAMGIINTTPDSFYAGSRSNVIEAVLSKADQMIREGALMLDLGGQSTRPGSDPVNEEEELRRVLPAVEAIHKNFPEVIISIDTYYASVARNAVEAGASMVNDISAGSIDKDLLSTVASLGVPYVLMHMLGKPSTMQLNPQYENVVLEVFDFISFKIRELTKLGINDIIIDPGFGFGKSAAHNFQLLKELSFFNKLDKPILAGLSRKGTIYKTLGVPVEESLNGTTVMNTIALMNEASILRVHDIKEAVQAIRLMKAYHQ